MAKEYVLIGQIKSRVYLCIVEKTLIHTSAS